MQAHHATSASPIFHIERPAPKLMTYYVLKCLLTGPLFPIVLIPHYFKYHTLRYRFDHEGVSMRWGILFRREVILNYSRIQDIHLSSNVIERWLGLAKLEIQTASGSAKAEMTLEGLLEFEAIRDFLYEQMRGSKDSAHRQRTHGPSASAASLSAFPELVQTLREIAEELKAVRSAIQARSGQEERPS